MLRWTPSGAVSAPTIVQIRAQQAFPGRIRVGAPDPTRSLSPQELEANLRYFTQGLRGPRSQACHGLILSGFGILDRPELSEHLRSGRELGIRTVVLHIGPEDLFHFEPKSLRSWVDHFVIRLGADLKETERVIQAAAAHQIALRLVLGLDPETLAVIDQLVSVVVKGNPAAIQLSAPFPGGAAPLSVGELRAAIANIFDIIPAGIPLSLKGLPPCLFPPNIVGKRPKLFGRTRNRWYVDAQHQQENALLFVPEVLNFHKADSCRWCSADPVCDGYFESWLAADRSLDLLPIAQWPPAGPEPR